MHFHLLSLFLAILPLAFASAVPTVTTRGVGTSGTELQPKPKYRPFLDYPNTPRWTNARRLAAGLPPLPPRRRSANAPRAEPSAIPHQILQGYLQVRSASTGSVMGYLSSLNSNGQLGGLVQDPSRAFKIKIDVPAASAGPSEIEFGEPPSRLLGAIGFTNSNGNLKVGSESSTNYASFGGVGTHTPPGSRPVTATNSVYATGLTIAHLVESSIFRYNSVTGEITAQWINTDGTSPTSYMAYTGSRSILIITADKNNAVLNAVVQPTWVSLYLVTA